MLTSNIVSEDTKNNNKFEKAKTLYNLGYNIIPAFYKEPLVKWKAYQSNRISRDTIRYWLTNPFQISPVNWMVLTGKKKYGLSWGLICVDGDDAEACALIEQRCPQTPLTTTTTRGKHYWYLRPDVEKVQQILGVIIGGKKYKLDIKADGCYAVAPGSVSASGHVYQWSAPWTQELIMSLPVYDPAWLPHEAPARERTKGQGGSVSVGDLSERETQARDWLANQSGTKADGSSGKKAFAIAINLLHGFDLDEESAVDLMYEWGQFESQTDEMGHPYYWSMDEIQHKIDGASNVEYEGKRGDKLEVTDRMIEDVIDPDAWGDLETKCVPPKKEQEASEANTADDASVDSDTKPDEDVQWGTYDTATGKPVTPKKLFEDWSEFSVNCEPEDWLIKNWLEFGSLGVLAGEPFSGKSHLVTDVIAAMVQGRKWARYDVPDVPIIIIDAENKKRILTKRMTEALDYGVDPNIYSGKVKRLDVAGVRDLLPLKVDDAADTIRKWIIEVKAAIKDSTDCEKMFVIIDTMRSVFDADEMEAKEMKALLYPLQRVAQEMNAAVLVLHHRPKSKAKYSGGSAIPSACDYFWVWDSEKEDMTGELELYGTRGDHEPKLHFQLRNGRNYYNEQKTAENIDGDRFFNHVVEILNGGEMNKGELVTALHVNKGYKDKDHLATRLDGLASSGKLCKFKRKGSKAQMFAISRPMDIDDENTL